MKTRTIQWLDIADFRIIKIISLVGTRNNNDVVLGRVVYTRPLTQDYSFAKQAEADKKNTDTLDKVLIGYPTQENYPSDELDEIIFQAFKEVCPGSHIYKDSLLFNVDIEKIDHVKNAIVIPAILYFHPDLSNVINSNDYINKPIDVPIISLNIYTHYNADALHTKHFYARYDITQPAILNNLNSIQFE